MSDNMYRFVSDTHSCTNGARYRRCRFVCLVACPAHVYRRGHAKNASSGACARVARSVHNQRQVTMLRASASRRGCVGVAAVVFRIARKREKAALGLCGAPFPDAFSLEIVVSSAFSFPFSSPSVVGTRARQREAPTVKVEVSVLDSLDFSPPSHGAIHSRAQHAPPRACAASALSHTLV